MKVGDYMEIVPVVPPIDLNAAPVADESTCLVTLVPDNMGYDEGIMVDMTNEGCQGTHNGGQDTQGQESVNIEKELLFADELYQKVR